MSDASEQSARTNAVRPFTIETSETELEALRDRIAATRWPSKELVTDRSQGVQLATIQELARYWATDYDWRKCQARLNALPQFKTEIDGVDIHFIHVKSPHTAALPLVITHGWPGSVIELLGVVSPLSDPAAHGGSAGDAFDLVLPSLPGFGFSAEPTQVGWDPGRIAGAWAELMRRLGYNRFVAQGGDLGAFVADEMARQAPAGLLGIHLNLLKVALLGPPPAEPTEEERAALAAIATMQTSGYGYFLEQATRPQTIGYALLDSPVALGGLDARPRHGQLLQDLPRLPGQATLGPSHPGQHPGQHHAVLADGHRGLGRPGVLGERASRSPCGRTDRHAGLSPSRIHGLPRRDLPSPAQLGPGGLPHPDLLPRGRQGRPLRRLGRARAVRNRDPGGVPLTSLVDLSQHCRIPSQMTKEADPDGFHHEQGDPYEHIIIATTHSGRPRLCFPGPEPPRRILRHVHQPIRRHRPAAPARSGRWPAAPRCYWSTAGRNPGTPGAW